MPRLTRKQSQSRTRSQLLDSAFEVVARDGYGGATIEKIAEEAGYSKGAFYSNFSSKEEILLQLIEHHAGGDIEELTALFEQHDDPYALIEALGDWADMRASDQRWGLIAIEALRKVRSNEKLSRRYRELFKEQWEDLGRLLIDKLFTPENPPSSPFYLGGTFFDLTYGGISTFLNANAPGTMIKLTLRAMYVAHGIALPQKKTQ